MFTKSVFDLQFKIYLRTEWQIETETEHKRSRVRTRRPRFNETQSNTTSEVHDQLPILNPTETSHTISPKPVRHQTDLLDTNTKPNTITANVNYSPTHEYLKTRNFGMEFVY